MNAPIVKKVTPELQELHRKRSQLAKLETKLAEKELYLATMEAELNVFHREYFK